MTLDSIRNSCDVLFPPMDTFALFLKIRWGWLGSTCWGSNKLERSPHSNYDACSAGQILQILIRPVLKIRNRLCPFPLGSRQRSATKGCRLSPKQFAPNHTFPDLDSVIIIIIAIITIIIVIIIVIIINICRTYRVTTLL